MNNKKEKKEKVIVELENGEKVEFTNGMLKDMIENQKKLLEEYEELLEEGKLDSGDLNKAMTI